VIKKTCVECLEKVLRGHRDIHLLIETKGEFLFETRKRRADKYSAQILEVMKSVVEGVPPLDVEIREGINWLDMNKKG
jgi:DNA polymerase I-like protein with 3'-5' exonuclease and polymerase domains